MGSESQDGKFQGVLKGCGSKKDIVKGFVGRRLTECFPRNGSTYFRLKEGPIFSVTPGNSLSLLCPLF